LITPKIICIHSPHAPILTFKQKHQFPNTTTKSSSNNHHPN
jgi:hypothetical protein